MDADHFLDPLRSFLWRQWFGLARPFGGRMDSVFDFQPLGVKLAPPQSQQADAQLPPDFGLFAAFGNGFQVMHLMRPVVRFSLVLVVARAPHPASYHT
jgi:hypothetical protein